MTSQAEKLGEITGAIIGAGIGIYAVVAIFRAFKLRTRKSIITASIFGGVVAVCVAAVAIMSLSGSGKKEPWQAASADRRFSFTAAAGWDLLPETKARMPAADIAVGNKRNGEFMILILEPRPEFPGTLAEYSEALAGFSREKLPEMAIKPPQPVKAGAFNSLQREMSGRQDGLQISWLQTVIETEDTWVQLSGWTQSENQEEGYVRFRQAVASFQRTGSPPEQPRAEAK